MTIQSLFVRGLLAGLLVGSFAPLQAQDATTSTATSATAKKWPDPKRFEPAIAAFETSGPAPQGAIVATGSSSMRGWHKTIAEDLAPLTIVPRGFGGSNINDSLHYLEAIVLKNKPRAVLLYQGDNDVAGGFPVAEIVGKFREFVQRIHAVLPEARIYILSVKPSPSRWKHWPTMSEVNAALGQLAAENPLVTFIDVATPMLGPDGQPKPDIFLSDKLHMNPQGYAIWRNVVKPVLMAKELQHEDRSTTVAR